MRELRVVAGAGALALAGVRAGCSDDDTTAGDFEVAVKTRAGQACNLKMGHVSSTSGSLKATAHADSLTSVSATCP